MCVPARVLMNLYCRRVNIDKYLRIDTHVWRTYTIIIRPFFCSRYVNSFVLFVLALCFFSVFSFVLLSLFYFSSFLSFSFLVFIFVLSFFPFRNN